MNPILVFDLETVPDAHGLRRLGLVPSQLDERQAIEHAQKERQEKTGSDFMPLPLHRVVCISCVFRDAHDFKVHSFCETDAQGEAALIQRFFRSIERHTPQLVSWNGAGFDLPVLHYRAMMHGVQAPRYWEMGDAQREFRYNNYINRYHMRHLDLMDLLALYQPRNNAKLDDMAKLCGLPGKLGVDGAQVAGLWLEGRIDDIRRYCETDVVNTYLLYLRWQRFAGQLPPEPFEEEEAFVRTQLQRLAQDTTHAPHWQEYLSAWTHPTFPSPMPATPGLTSPHSI